MSNAKKCLKVHNLSELSEKESVRIGECDFSLQYATEREITIGERALVKWRVERLYEVQVCGPSAPRGYLDKRVEILTIPFEELIFRHGECIGIYHDGCAMLFDDEKTHLREKWIGEFITGPDRTYDAYDYYRLIKN